MALASLRVTQFGARLTDVIPIVFIPGAPIVAAELNPEPAAELQAVIESIQTHLRPLAHCQELILLCSHAYGQWPQWERPMLGEPLTPPAWFEYPVDSADGLGAVRGAAEVSPLSQAWTSVLPTSASVALGLLRSVGVPRGKVRVIAVAGSALDRREHAHALAKELTANTGIVAVGEGSAGRSEKAPRHLIAEAAEFDAKLVQLLSDADVSALAQLSEQSQFSYHATGVPVWQTLATVVQEYSSEQDMGIVTMPFACSDPWGVAYISGSWRLTSVASRQHTSAE